MTQAELEALCAEWQKRLRLQDWNVRVRFLRHYALSQGQRAGEIMQHRHDQTAEVDICDPDDLDTENRGVPEVEQTLVHELIHILLLEWQVEAGTLEYWEQERAINKLADALLAAKREEPERTPKNYDDHPPT